MTNGAIGLIAAFAIAFVLAAAFLGVVLFPGFVLLLVLFTLIRPYRGVAVTESGVVQFDVSKMSGRASRPLALLSYWVLWPPYANQSGGKVRVQLVNDIVSLPRKDYERLVSTVSMPGTYGGPPAYPGGNTFHAHTAAPTFPQYSQNPQVPPVL